MVKDYLRGLNEEQFQQVLDECIKKVEGISDKDWEEIVTEYNLDIHRDVLRKAFQAPIGGYAVYKYLQEGQIHNISDNAILKEIEEKKLELEKEKIRMQDQRREWKKLVRVDGRFEHLVDTMLDELRHLNETKPFLNPYRPHIDFAEPIEGVLMLSDWHIGSKFKNALAEYNYAIATSRINDLLAKTIKYCRANDVTTLHLEILGDNINGLLHVGSRVEAEEDTISQLIKYQELLSEFIYQLSKEIPYIKVYSVIGNHARMSANLKESLRPENLERLVPVYLKARLQNVDNVAIVEECNIDESMVMFSVLGHTIVGVHGDLDKPNKVVDNIIKMFKIFPESIHMGHYHHDFEKTEYDISVIINGSLQGTDSFAYGIRKSGQAMQKLHIYNEDGKLCTYKINLK